MRQKQPPTSLGHKQATHYQILDSMLDVLDAHDGAGRAASRITLMPEGSPPVLEHRPMPPAGWPAFATGGPPLRPSTGWSQPGISPASAVVVVALFGLDSHGMRIALEQVARQQRESGGFAPIFFTDSLEHYLFRRKGYLVEYFPAEGTDNPASMGQFRERFGLLWRKWGASRLIDLSSSGKLEHQISGLDVLDYPVERDLRDKKWERPASPLPQSPDPDIAALRAQYHARGLQQEPDTFVFYRIIGNDLYPRHEVGQSLRNVQFILEHEPAFPDCEKRWVVNRIIDREAEAAVLALLDREGQCYLHMPFDWQDYAAQDWDFSGFTADAPWLYEPEDSMSARMRLRAETRLRRLKVNYAVNNNGARNAALADGRARAKWVLPWDGNCFMSQGAWDSMVTEIRARPHLKYFYTPMARLTDNALALTADVKEEAVEEPQLLFRRDAEEQFDEAFPYGRRPKVSLFWRLGIRGSWDLSRDDLWDLPRPQRSPLSTEFGRAGWVARLASGRHHLEASTRVSQWGREAARNEAIVATIDALDAEVLARRLRPNALLAYDEAGLDALASASLGTIAAAWRKALVESAEAALTRGPSSVVEKTVRSSSGDSHDYSHKSTYWWPHPASEDGRPCTRRDGERVPGDELCAPQSERCDCTRLQRLFDDAITTALAWRVSGDFRFAEHTARLIRRWFLDPDTKMSPHLSYAQLRPDDEADLGFGIIEMTNVHFFLDAVRLARIAGALDENEDAALREWLNNYLDWIRTSPEGASESRARNSRGTCFDLQVAAIGAYLGDFTQVSLSFRSAKARIAAQISAVGAQAEELGCTQVAYYTTFNLQCWTNLARLGETLGVDLWTYVGQEGGSLRAAFEWLLPKIVGHEELIRSAGYDDSRRLPLLAAAKDRLGIVFEDAVLRPQDWPLTFNPHDGIKPFWLVDHLKGWAAGALNFNSALGSGPIDPE